MGGAVRRVGQRPAKAVVVDSGNGRIYVAAGTSGLDDNDLDFVTVAHDR